MPGLLLIFAFQAAAASVPATTTESPQRFSILVPVADDPCVRTPGDDVVVCGKPLPSQKLPYPNEIVPDGPVPSNPELTGIGALRAESTPCSVSSRGCTVGFGPPIVPIIKGAVGLVKGAFAKKPDKTGRVAIPLDDAAPTGRIEP